ncbi:hypothetical protein [Streptomyces phaeochromogenes]|uniref:hypothetical protein n=1 Tax=Streptomyces phaeochromogenes TaxID=1923 RepID=UPI0033F38B8B
MRPQLVEVDAAAQVEEAEDVGAQGMRVAQQSAARAECGSGSADAAWRSARACVRSWSTLPKWKAR